MCYLYAGTVSLVSLMVGSAINQVFSERGLDFCMDEDMGSAFVDNVSNLTCGELKVEIAVSMAFTSGLMMVGVFYCVNELCQREKKKNHIRVHVHVFKDDFLISTTKYLIFGQPCCHSNSNLDL